MKVKENKKISDDMRVVPLLLDVLTSMEFDVLAARAH
jgi:hypothetical protein